MAGGGDFGRYRCEGVNAAGVFHRGLPTGGQTQKQNGKNEFHRLVSFVIGHAVRCSTVPDKADQLMIRNAENAYNLRR